MASTALGVRLHLLQLGVQRHCEDLPTTRALALLPATRAGPEEDAVYGWGAMKSSEGRLA